VTGHQVKYSTRKQNDKKIPLQKKHSKEEKRKEISLLPKHSPPPFVKHFRKPGQISPFNAHVQEGVKEKNTHCKKKILGISSIILIHPYWRKSVTDNIVEFEELQ
jgi:hypothetical protein